MEFKPNKNKLIKLLHQNFVGKDTASQSYISVADY